MNTSAGSRHNLLAVRSFFEPLLTSLHYLVYHVYVYFSELSLKMAVNHSVQLTKHLTQLRVEVVFDAVVGSTCTRRYFPWILAAIDDHLLRISL